MPIPVRRFVYGVLSAVGFIMMVPLMIASRQISAQLSQSGAFDVRTGFDFSVVPGYEWRSALFLAGLTLAAGFLYAALSVGHARAWRPRENGTPRCVRCEAELPFAIRRCPACDQHLIW